MSLLWTIVIVLAVLWALGFFAFPAVSGSLIHILLAAALVMAIYNLWTNRGPRA